MESLVSPDNTCAIIAVMTAMIAASFLLQRFYIFRSFGPVLTVILMGAVLSNSGIMPRWASCYDFFIEYAVPVSLCLILLNVDIRDFLKVARRPMFAMILGLVSLCVVALIAGVLFAPHIDEGWKVAGMFIGTYTGGSTNLSAIGLGLQASPHLFMDGNAADYALGIPVIMIYFMLPRILMRSRRFRRIWPYSLKTEQLSSPDDGLPFTPIQWSIRDIAILFAISFSIVSLCTEITEPLSPMMASSARILLITTVTIVMSEFEWVRKLRGAVDLGFYVCLFFLCIIGFMLNLAESLKAAPLIVFFCFSVVVGSMFLHLLLCRLFRIEWQYFLISSLAAIWDGPTTAMLAGALEWTSLVSLAIILGAFGEAVANYLGIGLAFMIKALIGA